MMKATTLICFAAAAVASPHELETRQSSKVATVDLAVSACRGTPNQLASGVLYGIPDQQGQIPDRFFTEPKLHYFRAGGAQMGRPGRGWHYNEYTPRFQSTLSNYQTARKYGGEFQMLPHDIWGTDSTNSSSKWPGDDGDWTNYEAFLDRLIADIKANNMIPGLKIDTWNEPNLSIFWKRSVDQWLEMWKRTYQKFRADPAVRSVPIVGPSMNVGPDPNNSWWDKFMKYIVANNVAPDEYTWHLLSGTTGQTNDLRFSVPAMNQFFASTGAPRRPFCVNEYINSGDERMNAAMAWHIARFEHYDTSGLRSNWLGGSGLHDFLAELIYRPNTGVAYQPNGAWQLYRYYAQSMTGVRLGSDGSSDGAFDVFATLSSDNVVHILAGVRAQTGTWQIQVKNMQALGFPASGEVSVKTLAFVDVGAQGVSNGSTDRGTQKINYSGGVLTLSVVQTGQDTKTAWAFEFQKA